MGLQALTPTPALDDEPAPFSEARVLSPEWLTKVLGARYSGAVVTAVNVTERLETVATKERFTVEYATPVDAPHAFCVKAYFNPAMQARAATGQPEVSFYIDVAPSAAMRVPPCVYAAVDPATGHGLILMEDLKAQNCTFLTALSPYSTDQAKLTLNELALMHARYWASPLLDEHAFLKSRLETITNYVTNEQLQAHLDDPRGEGVPADVLSAERLTQALLATLKRNSGEPKTLVHGDAHAGNLYVPPDGRPGIIDWQVVQGNTWAMDVAYHLGAVLTTADREAHERELLEHYLARLAAHGGPSLTWDDAWLGYRINLIYGYYMWAITKMVDRPIINEFTQRLGNAVAFHDSYGLIGK
ncbi:MAG: phosphotransferase [Acidimicrobiia bacterium]